MALSIKPDSTSFRKSKTFRHAGDLNARFDTLDPRSPPFSAEQLDLDLSECEFVLAPASMWCVVYSVLASRRHSQCRLLVPQNMGVCLYLKSLGLFDILKENKVEVDDRGIASRSDPKTILPITPFRTTADATTVTNQAFDNLQSSQIGAVNLTSVVTELLGELTMNAAQHSESEIGAFACVQFVETKGKERFVCTVADGGIGVLASLRKNDALRSRVCYDWDALELAIQERISGTGDPNRGIGLYGVRDELRRPEHSLLLHSGIGSLEVTEKQESQARRTRLFPGTLAYLSIPT